MEILPSIIIVATVVLIIFVIKSLKSKNEEKLNSAFNLNDQKLNYRKKLVSSLWNFPIMLVVYFAIYWFADLSSRDNLYIGIIFLIVLLIDLAHNYAKWRRNEKLVNN